MSSESESKASNHLDVAGQRPRTASSETGSLDDSGVSNCSGITPPLISIHRNSLSKEIDRDAQPRLHRPWIDPTPQFSSVSNVFAAGLSPRPEELNHPYYFRLLHPSLAIQSELVRLPYQLAAQFSRHY